MPLFQPISPSNPQIILASGSPRRRTLLQQCGFDPVVITSDIEEKRHPNETARDYTQRLAGEKVVHVAQRLSSEFPDLKTVRFIVGADTVVVHNGQLLEKPKLIEDAYAMLCSLSGKTHTVITSFALLDRCRFAAEGATSIIIKTREPKVRFRQLSEEIIRNYIATGDPMDKAGSYGIQSVGATLVDSIEGSFFAVVGLPIADLIATLEELCGLENFPFS